MIGALLTLDCRAGKSRFQWGRSPAYHCCPKPGCAPRRGLRSGAIDVVLDQNPDGEIREAIAAARSLALGSSGKPVTDPIEIGIFLRDNLR